MKNKGKLLGLALVIAAITLNALLVTGCNNDPSPDGPPYTPPTVAHYDDIHLLANRWSDADGLCAEQWDSDIPIKLSDFTTVKLKQGDTLNFKISGVSDKELKYFQIQLFQRIGSDWDTYKWLGASSPLVNLPYPSFNNHIIGDTYIWNDPNPNPNAVIYVGLVNTLWQKNPSGEYIHNSGETIPADIAQDTVMATISNFSISLDSIVTPGTLTITNFSGSPGLTQNNYLDGGAYIYDYNTDDRYLSFYASVYGQSTQIKGNTLTLSVWEETYTYNEETEDTIYSYVPFTGNITVAAGYLSLYQYNDDGDWTGYTNKVPITFKNGNATINFRTQMEEDTGSYSDDEHWGGYWYTEENDAITITVYAGAGGSVTIPAQINGKSVISIGERAFKNCLSLTSVTIPDSVTSIELGAFWGCPSLTSVTIGNSVTSIGDEAFFYCTSLASVTIGNGVTSIGSAFQGCTSLTSITIPNSVTSIGDYAFSDCTSLASITIPASVTSIGDFAFQDCTSLASVTIPNSVTSIGVGAFRDCTSLASITIPESITSIGDFAFQGCTSLTSVTFQGTLTRDNFDYTVFDGDLYSKYFEWQTNVTPGTYTTTAPVDYNSVWTKQ